MERIHRYAQTELTPDN